MNDDWRLEIDAAGAASEIVERLASRELAHDLSRAFGDTVIVSRDRDAVFLYAGSREQVERAGGLVSRLAADRGWQLRAALTRWHPEAEEWKDPELPLPRDPESRRAEHAEAIAAERLEPEGLSLVRRWKYLVVAAEDEDAAKALAERLRSEAPAGGEVTVEGSGRVAWEERPANPFAIFGGLGV
jgi:hypothetical protein